MDIHHPFKPQAFLTEAGLPFAHLFGYLAGSRRCQAQLVVCVETKSINITLLSQNHCVISCCSNLRAVMGDQSLHHTGNLKQTQLNKK